MAQTVENRTVTKLGVLLQRHSEAVTLGRELIRIALCARVANQVDYALAAERAAEDSIAEAVRLEEQLRREL